VNRKPNPKTIEIGKNRNEVWFQSSRVATNKSGINAAAGRMKPNRVNKVSFSPDGVEAEGAVLGCLLRESRS
jgi:hypothetical protein